MYFQNIIKTMDSHVAPLFLPLNMDGVYEKSKQIPSCSLFFVNFKIGTFWFPKIVKKISDVDNVWIYKHAKFQRKLHCIMGYKKRQIEQNFNFLNCVLFTTQIHPFVIFSQPTIQ